MLHEKLTSQGRVCCSTIRVQSVARTCRVKTLPAVLLLLLPLVCYHLIRPHYRPDSLLNLRTKPGSVARFSRLFIFRARVFRRQAQLLRLRGRLIQHLLTFFNGTGGHTIAKMMPMLAVVTAVLLHLHQGRNKSRCVLVCLLVIS